MLSSLTLLITGKDLDRGVAGDFVLDELALFIDIDDDGGAALFAVSMEDLFQDLDGYAGWELGFDGSMYDAADIGYFFGDAQGFHCCGDSDCMFSGDACFLFVPGFVHGFLAGVTTDRPRLGQDDLHVLRESDLALGGDTFAADGVGLGGEFVDLCGAQVFLTPVPQGGWADLVLVGHVGDGQVFCLVDFLDHVFAHGPICFVAELCEY